ncbi:MAG: hypothetical protein AcusKO_34330 [Acuticoccus sp.]
MLAQTDTPRVAVISMQKNEAELLPIWLAYYHRLIGAENVYLIDNGSDIDAARVQLVDARRSGVNVIDKPGQDAFERKGPVIQRLARSLADQYDVIIPIDGDEFLTLKADPGTLMSRDTLHSEASAFLRSERDYALITCHFLNVANTPIVVRREFRKVFIRPNTEFTLNRGFHFQPAEAAEGHESGFAYLHFHHKADIEVMQNLAIPKIGEDRYKTYLETGREAPIKGKGKHMAKYIDMSQDRYQKYMQRISGEQIDVSDFFASFDQPVPFAAAPE